MEKIHTWHDLACYLNKSEARKELANNYYSDDDLDVIKKTINKSQDFKIDDLTLFMQRYYGATSFDSITDAAKFLNKTNDADYEDIYSYLDGALRTDKYKFYVIPNPEDDSKYIEFIIGYDDKNVAFTVPHFSENLKNGKYIDYFIYPDKFVIDSYINYFYPQKSVEETMRDMFDGEED